jgi:hypothetical protein
MQPNWPRYVGVEDERDERPLGPFGGGEVNLLGLLYRVGNLLSWRESGQYFADIGKLAGMAKASRTPVSDGVAIEQLL